MHFSQSPIEIQIIIENLVYIFYVFGGFSQVNFSNMAGFYNHGKKWNKIEA